MRFVWVKRNPCGGLGEVPRTVIAECVVYAKDSRKGSVLYRLYELLETKTKGDIVHALSSSSFLQDLAHSQALALAEVKHRVGAGLMPGYGPTAKQLPVLKLQAF